MLDRLKDRFSFIFESRLNIIFTLFVLFSCILVGRLFVLQIIKGNYYQNNYSLKIAKVKTVEANRGNIYDRNGNLLAYNELSYAVTITDSGTYADGNKNQILNKEIYKVIKGIEENGDSIENTFNISLSKSGKYEFKVSGSSLQRFRADIFGYSSIYDLEEEDKYGINEQEATADDIMNYLCGSHRYDISDKYSKEMQYKIAIVRYGMSQNSYQKYISTTIASNVSDETVAFIKENAADFTGVEIEEKSIRKYTDPEAFASIIGYTGTISTDEYEELSEEDESVEKTDTIGKAGIESYMNSYLSGTKGSETLYVDSVGNVIGVSDYTEPVSGNDVYLSIDKDLQQETYNLLEQEVAGILYSKIVNIKEYNSSDNSSSSDVVIPIYDVYYALIDNSLIDVDALSDDDATDLEKTVASEYNLRAKTVYSNMKNYLKSNSPTIYNQLPEEYQKYMTYEVKKLKSDGIFDSSKIDSSSDIQTAWTSESLSVNEYLTYAIAQEWIDITQFTVKDKYVDTDELYDALVDYMLEDMQNDSGFTSLIYKYAILDDAITGNQLCAILYDQGFLEEDQETRDGLANGSISAYSFMLQKIQNLEITPGDLALDPCSASSVVIDSKTGEVLACVSYPGYDNNKLANSMDSEYYSKLLNSGSNPLYNHATQQRTAPGSTFKPISATAGLAEGIITPETEITDLGIFEKVSNKPRCWYYTQSHGTHGSINVSEALRDSCNYFFYEIGYDLAGGSSSYDDARGISLLQKYAALYGLDSKTGVEIEENTPSIATEYPVMAAIGQSNNNFTTISLARYVTALSNSGTVYNLTLLDHVSDADGNELKTYQPEVKNNVNVLNNSQWDAIHYGMRLVVENMSTFDGFPIEIAGKTGTAQQVTTRPNHALFIGYAPYSSPEIAVATRIPYGYTSHNAADVTKYIIGCYFKDEESLSIANGGGANSVNSSGNSFTD